MKYNNILPYAFLHLAQHITSMERNCSKTNVHNQVHQTRKTHIPSGNGQMAARQLKNKCASASDLHRHITERGLQRVWVSLFVSKSGMHF